MVSQPPRYPSTKISPFIFTQPTSNHGIIRWRSLQFYISLRFSALLLYQYLPSLSASIHFAQSGRILSYSALFRGGSTLKDSEVKDAPPSHIMGKRKRKRSVDKRKLGENWKWIIIKRSQSVKRCWSLVERSNDSDFISIGEPQIGIRRRCYLGTLVTLHAPIL